LTVLRHGSNQWQVSGDETVTTVDRLKGWLRGGTLFIFSIPLLLALVKPEDDAAG